MKNNIYTKDYKDIKSIFENFWKQTNISRNEPYMYMFSDKKTNKDYFKHSLTREYVEVES